MFLSYILLTQYFNAYNILQLPVYYTTNCITLDHVDRVISLLPCSLTLLIFFSSVLNYNGNLMACKTNWQNQLLNTVYLLINQCKFYHPCFRVLPELAVVLPCAICCCWRCCYCWLYDIHDNFSTYIYQCHKEPYYGLTIWCFQTWICHFEANHFTCRGVFFTARIFAYITTEQDSILIFVLLLHFAGLPKSWAEMFLNYKLSQKYLNERLGKGIFFTKIIPRSPTPPYQMPIYLLIWYMWRSWGRNLHPFPNIDGRDIK